MPPKASSSKSKQRRRVYNTNLFDTISGEERWGAFQERPIVSGRKVIHTDFHRYNISYLYHRLNWTDFMGLQEPYYPNLVRYFYCNMRWTEDRSTIISYVKGRTIEFGIDDICDLLQLPNTENRVYFDTKGTLPDSVGDIDRRTILNTVCVDGFDGIKPKSGDLKPVARLLHRFHAFNILPRGGHYDVVHPFQLYLIYATMEGIHINLGHIILQTMMDASSKDISLPYGMALTRIFRNCDVNFASEIKGKEVSHFNYTTMKLMGMEDAPPAALVDEGHDGDEEEDVGDQPNLPQRATLEDLEALENRIYAHVDARFDAVDARMDAHDAHIDARFNEVMDFFRNRFP